MIYFQFYLLGFCIIALDNYSNIFIFIHKANCELVYYVSTVSLLSMTTRLVKVMRCNAKSQREFF